MATCSRRACGQPAWRKELCTSHYEQERSARARLKKGLAPTWPRLSEYWPLARTCPKCGELVTSEGIRRTASPWTPCRPCLSDRWHRQYLKDRPRVAERSRAIWDRGQAASLERAVNAGKTWTGPELEIVADRSKTIREVAQLLGRSMSAVRSARHRVEIEPRYRRLADLTTKGYQSA